MFTDVHTDFILTPLLDILSDGVNASTPIPAGIESSAISDYFLQSLFLRMTGAQEQKMKCICWVMATNDYRYRYELLNFKHYGECSEYKDKRDVYKDLINLIQGLDESFTPKSILDIVTLPDGREEELRDDWKKRVDKNRRKQVDNIIDKKEAKGIILSKEVKDSISSNVMGKPYPIEDFNELIYGEKKNVFVKNTVTRLNTLLEYSPLVIWNYRGYIFFKDHWGDVMNGKQLILASNELFGSGLQGYYQQLVYVHRNQTAHNTSSYLKDVPTLDALSDEGYSYKNYFFRFAILLLIDDIFVQLFKMYRTLSI